MKTVKETLLLRRSIRRYERTSLSQEQISFIHNAIRNTPTSYNGQQFSVIEIDDQELKQKLYEITGQKQIKTCASFLLFCADYNKISLGAKAKGLEMPPFNETFDGVTVGMVDASLAMMSALVAAEASGLGTCPIGYARTAAPEKIAELLHLPKGVLVVCGLAIGVPRELPDLKPKQPESLMIFKNRYPEQPLTDAILKYDEAITEFNQTRAGTKSDNDWISHILSYYREAMDFKMLEALRSRGFDIKK